MKDEAGRMDTPLAAALGRAAEPLTGEARSRIKARVMAEVEHSPAGCWTRLLAHRFAVAFTAVAVVSGGTAYAANAALPGQPLYGLKRAGENALVAIVPEGRLERGLLAALAERRAREARSLGHHDETTNTIGTRLREIQEEAERATQLRESYPESTHDQTDGHTNDAPAKDTGGTHDSTGHSSSPDGNHSGTSRTPGTGTGTDSHSGTKKPDSGHDSDSGTGGHRSGSDGTGHD